MKIEIATKNYELPQKLNDLIEKKVGRLTKYLDENCRVKVFCKAEKENLCMELTAFVHKSVLRAEVVSLNMYENLDNALKKLERQIVKRNTKHDNKSKKGANKEWLFNEEIPEPVAKRIVRTKAFSLKPISIEMAIEELENLDHNFYVFQNEDTKQINVIYKRNDGDYGVIETMI